MADFANNDAEFAFKMDVLREPGANDGSAGRKDGRGRLEKDKRLDGNFVAQFFCVLAIVAAGADDLAQQRQWREQGDFVKRQRAGKLLGVLYAGQNDAIGETCLGAVQLRAGESVGDVIGTGKGFEQAIARTIIEAKTTETHENSEEKINAEDATKFRNDEWEKLTIDDFLIDDFRNAPPQNAMVVTEVFNIANKFSIVIPKFVIRHSGLNRCYCCSLGTVSLVSSESWLLLPRTSAACTEYQ
jgi:hypothetical protein